MGRKLRARVASPTSANNHATFAQSRTISSVAGSQWTADTMFEPSVENGHGVDIESGRKLGQLEDIVVIPGNATISDRDGTSTRYHVSSTTLGKEGAEVNRNYCQRYLLNTNCFFRIEVLWTKAVPVLPSTDSPFKG